MKPLRIVREIFDIAVVHDLVSQRFTRRFKYGVLLAEMLSKNRHTKVKALLIKPEQRLEKLLGIFIIFPPMIPENERSRIRSVLSYLLEFRTIKFL